MEGSKHGAGMLGNASRSKSETISGGAGSSQHESAGVKDGLSSRMAMDVNSGQPTQDFARNPMNGNASERIKSVGRESVSGKGGKFEIC